MAGSPDDPPSGRHSRTISLLVATAVLLTSVAMLAYGDNFGIAWGGIAALLGVPFALGVLVGQAIDRSQIMGCFVWPTLAVVGLLALAYAIFGEGVICIAMVMPLWIVAAIAGTVTSILNNRSVEPGNDNRLRLAAWTVAPAFLLVVENSLPAQWTQREVAREIIVNAAPAAIWPQLIEIRNVAPSEGKWTFTQDVLGVPRPVDARLEYGPVGIVRKAQWGEGVRFEEHVVAAHTNRDMQWRFVFPDQSLQHHTDRHIAPNGETVRILSGGYTLEPLADGRTRIRLSTKYAVRSRLTTYFDWWGDLLLGDLQANVLEVVAGRTDPGHRRRQSN